MSKEHIITHYIICEQANASAQKRQVTCNSTDTTPAHADHRLILVAIFYARLYFVSMSCHHCLVRLSSCPTIMLPYIKGNCTLND